MSRNANFGDARPLSRKKVRAQRTRQRNEPGLLEALARSAEIVALNSRQHTPSAPKTFVEGPITRKHRRKDFTMGARMHFGDGLSDVPCMVLDISDGGARLHTSYPQYVPKHFILYISLRAKIRRLCKVAWRGKSEIGVKFVQALQAEPSQAGQATTEPLAEPSTGNTRVTRGRRFYSDD
jgi:hypothetical protein